MISRAIAIVALLFSFQIHSTASAVDAADEIEHLITTIGDGDCTFIRNGKTYDAEDAEAHLRLKYKRGRRYASTAEDFIRNLASKSSMSKKPYHIECDGEERVESGVWLMQRLVEYRETN